MTGMTDSKAMEVLSELRDLAQTWGTDDTNTIPPDDVAALDIAIARLREPAGAGAPVEDAVTRMCETYYGVQFNYSKGARDKMRRLLDAALAQQPAVVDGAMVERMVEAFLASTGQQHSVTQLQRDLTTECMKAALAAQPGGSDNDR